MDIAGLSLGVVGLAAQLYKTSTECYDVLSDTGSFGVDHDGLKWQVDTEKARLVKWENAWGVSSGTLNQKLDPGDYRYRYAVGTLARIVALFASVETLNTKYGIRVTTSSPRKRDKIFAALSLRPRNGSLKASSNAAAAPGASTSSITPPNIDPNGIYILQNPAMLENKDLVPGLGEEITRIGETTTRLQKMIPYYKKLRWAITDKSKFNELIEELRRYNDGLYSVLPDPGPLQLQPSTPPPFPKFNIPVQLPVQRNKRFVGRVDLLDRLHKILNPQHGQNNRERQVAVLYGLGGMGKSHIVTEYAYRHSPSYTSVFWVDATSQATLAHSSSAMIEQLVSHYETKWHDSTPDFTEIGEMLGLPGFIKSTGQIREECPKELVSRAVKKWLSSVGNDGWLVVFDNHDDIDTVKLLDFFPTCNFGSIIVTTRRPEVKHLGIGVEIGEIEKGAGISILLASASKDTQTTGGTDYEEASKIAEKLGYLPLALDQAGGHISAMQMPLANYLPLYSTNFKHVSSANHPGLLERYRSDTLFTTWKISFDSLPPSASNLLYLCAFLADGNQDIPQELFSRAKGNISWLSKDSRFIDDGIHALLSFSLAKQINVHDETRLCFHPLVLEWTRENIDQREQQKFVSRAIALLAASFILQSNKTVSDWAFERRVSPHVDISLHHLQKFLDSSSLDVDVDFADATAFMGGILERSTRYGEAEGVIRKALKFHQEIAGSREPTAQSSLALINTRNLGWVLFQKNRFDEALEFFEQALAGEEQLSGRDSLNTLVVMSNISWVLSLQKKHQTALEMQGRALAGYERVCGEEHPDTLVSVFTMAIFTKSQGKYAEAQKLFERTLAGQEKVLGRNHPDTLRTIREIAKALLSQGPGRCQEVLELCRGVLASQEDLLGPQHLDTIYTVYTMGLAYQNDGRYKEALELYQRVLVGREKTIGMEHPDTLRAVKSIAETYYQNQKYQEALGLYQRVLVSHKKVLGEEHPDTGSAIVSVALCLQSQGKYQEAADLHRQALAVQERVLGGEHPDTLSTIHNIAISSQAQGKIEEAFEWYERAKAGREKVLGKEHPDTLRTMHDMATIINQKGKNQEALDLWEEVRVGQEQALGKNHPDALFTIVSMATAVQGLGRYNEALELYKRALAGQEEILGPQHPITLRTIHYMGSAKKLQGEIEEAFELFQRALVGQEEVLGKEHFDTLITITTIAAAFHTEGRYQEAADLYRRVLAGWRNLFGPDDSRTISAAIELSVVEEKVQQ